MIFDSALEMKYYKEVVLPGVSDGSIIDFELQKEFVLLPSFTSKGKKYRAIKYVCDFYLVYSDGSTAVIDVKGMPDQKSGIKKKLFIYNYPDENLIWLSYSKKYGGWIDYEEYLKLKRKDKKNKRKTV